MNWQNVNSDPTWAVIDNWYWRSWEVCIGIIAACIPALRPGYKTLSVGLRSYLAHRSSQKFSTLSSNRAENPIYAHSDEAPIAQHGADSAKQPIDPRGAAGRAAAAEIDRAALYGVGEENFAMKSLPGDKSTMNQSIKKTTQVDVDIGSHRNPGPDDDGRSEGGRYFV